MGDIFKYNLKPVIKFLSRLSPSISAGESQIRTADKEKAANGDFGGPAKREPSVVEGRLNRGKLLLGTTIFYENSHIGEEDIKRIAEGGFDFIINESSGEFQNKLIRLCEKYGVALISKDASLPSSSNLPAALESGRDLFGEVVHHPIRIGDTAGDEPHASLFRAIGRYYLLYKQRFPEKFLFVNLFPAGVPPKLLGAKNYTEYIAAFVREVPADFISLDEYPFFSIGFLKRYAFTVCLHTYEVVGAACRENNRDLWLYLQTQGHWFDGIYTLPTYEQIRWQAYTALAYGAKCLMHVSYTPVWGSESYAMTDKQGQSTEQYLYAKRVNEELSLLSPLYMKYKSLGVLPAEAGKETEYLKPALKKQKKNAAQKEFRGLSCVESVCSEYSALAGYFEHTEGRGAALMIVNCRDLYSPAAGQEVCVRLRYPCAVTLYKNGIKQDPIINTLFSIRLASCEGVFATIEKI